MTPLKETINFPEEKISIDKSTYSKIVTDVKNL